MRGKKTQAHWDWIYDEETRQENAKCKSVERERERRKKVGELKKFFSDCAEMCSAPRRVRKLNHARSPFFLSLTHSRFLKTLSAKKNCLLSNELFQSTKKKKMKLKKTEKEKEGVKRRFEEDEGNYEGKDEEKGGEYVKQELLFQLKWSMTNQWH